MNIISPSSGSAELEYTAIIQNLYKSLAPNSQCGQNEISLSREILQGFSNQPSRSSSGLPIQKITDSIRQHSSEHNAQAFVQLLEKLRLQIGVSKRNEILYILNSLNNLGQRRKIRRPAPLASVHSVSTSSTSSVSSRNNGSISSRNSVVPFYSSNPTSHTSVSITAFKGPDIPRSLGIQFYYNFFF